MKVELTQQQIKNLEKFLSRVELKGNEALAFAEIITTIRNSISKQVGEK